MVRIGLDSGLDRGKKRNELEGQGTSDRNHKRSFYSQLSSQIRPSFFIEKEEWE
jgi:hypothetical protein